MNVETLFASPITGWVGGATATVVTGVILLLIKRRLNRGDRAEQWYENALGLVARVQQAALQTTTYQPADYDTLGEKLDSLAAEMQNHAASAPQKVDDESRDELIQLATFSAGFVPLTERISEQSGIGFFRMLQDSARENWNGQHDIGDVTALLDGIEVSSDIDQLSQDDSVTVDEDAVDELLDYFSEESLEAGYPTSVEEALNIPSDTLEEAFGGEDGLNLVMDKAMSNYVRMLLIQFSNRAGQRIEARKPK